MLEIHPSWNSIGVTLCNINLKGVGLCFCLRTLVTLTSLSSAMYPRSYFNSRLNNSLLNFFVFVLGHWFLGCRSFYPEVYTPTLILKGLFVFNSLKQWTSDETFFTIFLGKTYFTFLWPIIEPRHTSLFLKSFPFMYSLTFSIIIKSWSNIEVKKDILNSTIMKKIFVNNQIFDHSNIETKNWGVKLKIQ